MFIIAVSEFGGKSTKKLRRFIKHLCFFEIVDLKVRKRAKVEGGFSF